MYRDSEEKTDYATSHLVHADLWSLWHWPGDRLAPLQCRDTSTYGAAGRGGRSDADVSYRVAAMRFLAEHGDKEALPVLQQVLNSSHEQPSVLEAAAQSHAAITSGQVPAQGAGITVPRDTGSGTRSGGLELPGMTRSR